MKNLITISILLLAFSMNAQNVKTSGTHFAQGVDSKKWNNFTDQSTTLAKFKDYTGESYVTFVAEKDVELLLDYSLKLSEGEADVVFSGNGTTNNLATLFVKNGNGNASDRKTVKLLAGKEYRLVFTGKNSKGKFECNWTEL